MEIRDGKIRLYSPQAEAVWQAVERDGTAFSRRAYVQKKYEESAAIFTSAYDAYVKEAVNYAAKPEGAEYPYWAFASARDLDASMGSRVMHLNVPLEETVLFDMFDWYRVLRLTYLGSTPEEEEAFDKKVRARGLRSPDEAVLTPFYPDIKREILDSWRRNLFRHNDALKAGDDTGVRAVQAGLWRIRKEWFWD